MKGNRIFMNKISEFFFDIHRVGLKLLSKLRASEIRRILQYREEINIKNNPIKVMVQYQGTGQSCKLAPSVEAFENQHFKLLIGEDYANLS